MCLVKYVLFTFNFLFFLCGGLLLGIGIWLKVDNESIPHLLGIIRDLNKAAGDSASDALNTNVVALAAYILIAAGAVIMVISFLGCCGACLGNKCLLAMYAIFLFLILGLEIAAAVYGWVKKDDFKKNTQTLMLKSIQEFYGVDGDDDQGPATASWNVVQQEFQCCAVNNYEDYAESKYTSKTTNAFPPSCCKDFKQWDLCKQNSDVYSNKTQGCFSKFEDWIKKHIAIIGGVAIGVGVVQILGIIFATWMGCSLNPLK